MPRLKIGAADRVDDHQPEGHRPARVDAQDVIGVNIAPLALSKLKAANSKLQSPQQERDDRSASCPRQGHLQPAENDLQHLEATLKVSTAHQLLSCLSVQFKKHPAEAHALEIGVRGFGATAGVRQRIAQLLIEEAEGVVLGIGDVDGQPIETRRALERQRIAGTFGSGGRVPRCELPLSGAQVMLSQRLGIDSSRVLESAGERKMTGLQSGGVELIENRCSNAIVKDL